MGNIDDICGAIVNNIDGAIACGVINLDEGILLGIFNGTDNYQLLNEAIVNITNEVFCNSSFNLIEDPPIKSRDFMTNGGHYIKELNITSINYFYFAKLIKYGRAAVILITDNTISLGMGWIQLKAAIPNLEMVITETQKDLTYY